MATIDDVKRLLARDDFCSVSRDFDRREQIKMSDSIGPPMLLLSAKRLGKLGYIPAFSEGEAERAIDAIEKHGAPTVEVFMVSHRWARPNLESASSFPDSVDHTKAKALIDYFEWRRSWVKRKHGFDPQIYLWLDYSCFDREMIDRDLVMLPLWVACCERFVRVESPDYYDRAWCRLEVMLSVAYQFADHHAAIPAGTLTLRKEDGLPSFRKVGLPSRGVATDPNDLDRIRTLEDVALTRIGKHATIAPKVFRF